MCVCTDTSAPRFTSSTPSPNIAFTITNSVGSTITPATGLCLAAGKANWGLVQSAGEGLLWICASIYQILAALRAYCSSCLSVLAGSTKGVHTHRCIDMLCY
jgi:hypothetical protein